MNAAHLLPRGSVALPALNQQSGNSGLLPLFGGVLAPCELSPGNGANGGEANGLEIPAHHLSAAREDFSHADILVFLVAHAAADIFARALDVAIRALDAGASHRPNPFADTAGRWDRYGFAHGRASVILRRGAASPRSFSPLFGQRIGVALSAAAWKADTRQACRGYSRNPLTRPNGIPTPPSRSSARPALNQLFGKTEELPLFDCLPVAQLDSAGGFYPLGCGFESYRAGHLSAARERCSDGRKVPTAAIREGVMKRPALNLPLFGGPSTSVLFGKGAAQAERRERRMGHLSAAQYPYEMFGASCGHCATARRFAAALNPLGMVPGRIVPRGHAETSPSIFRRAFSSARVAGLAFLLSPKLPGLRAPALFW